MCAETAQGALLDASNGAAAWESAVALNDVAACTKLLLELQVWAVLLLVMVLYCCFWRSTSVARAAAGRRL
jgi:hypothetical protein